MALVSLIFLLVYQDARTNIDDFHLLSPISNTYLAPASALLTAFSLIVSVKNQMKKIKLIHNWLTYFATKNKLWWQWKTLTRGATLTFKFKFKTVLNFFENMRYIKKLMFVTKFLSTLSKHIHKIKRKTIFEWLIFQCGAILKEQMSIISLYKMYLFTNEWIAFYHITCWEKIPVVNHSQQQV